MQKRSRLDIDDDFYDGGTFNPWACLYELNGGSFDWADGIEYNGGVFKKPHIYYVKSMPRTMNEQRIYCK